MGEKVVKVEAATNAEAPKKKRKTTTPPDGYVCSICGKPGHWVQQCPQYSKKHKNKKKKKNNHVPVAGVDPSQSDIDNARELQKIRPPKCPCNIPSRLRKVKRSSAGEDSRAIGKYFFFCNKKKDDESKCHFARPVEEQRALVKVKKGVLCFFYKMGKCTKGEDRCEFSHDKGLLEEAKKEDEIKEKAKLREEKELKEKEIKENKEKIVDEKNLPFEIVKTKVESDSSSSSGSSSDSSSDSDSDR